MDFIRPRKVSGGIDLAPLIDCVFLLLLFFMLSSSFPQPAVPLDLPSAGSAEQPPPPTKLTVSVDATGQLFVMEEPVALEDLGVRLMALADGDTDTPVMFRGDRGMAYDVFLQIMAQTREAGFNRLALQHEPAAAPSP